MQPGELIRVEMVGGPYDGQAFDIPCELYTLTLAANPSTSCFGPSLAGDSPSASDIIPTIEYMRGDLRVAQMQYRGDDMGVCIVQFTDAEWARLIGLGTRYQSAYLLKKLMWDRVAEVNVQDVQRVYMAIAVDGGTDCIPDVGPGLRDKLCGLFQAAGCFRRGRLEYRQIPDDLDPATAPDDRAVIPPDALWSAVERMAAVSFPQSWMEDGSPGYAFHTGSLLWYADPATLAALDAGDD